MPFLFSAITMRAVGRAAFSIVNEVRRQFREIPGIMEGTGRPEYARCVDISTRGALREMILPGILAVASSPSSGIRTGDRGPWRASNWSCRRGIRAGDNHGQRGRGLGQRQRST